MENINIANCQLGIWSSALLGRTEINNFNVSASNYAAFWNYNTNSYIFNLGKILLREGFVEKSEKGVYQQYGDLGMRCVQFEANQTGVASESGTVDLSTYTLGAQDGVNGLNHFDRNEVAIHVSSNKIDGPINLDLRRGYNHFNNNTIQIKGTIEKGDPHFDNTRGIFHAEENAWTPAPVVAAHHEMVNYPTVIKSGGGGAVKLHLNDPKPISAQHWQSMAINNCSALVLRKKIDDPFENCSDIYLQTTDYGKIKLSDAIYFMHRLRVEAKYGKSLRLANEILLNGMQLQGDSCDDFRQSIFVQAYKSAVESTIEQLRIALYKKRVEKEKKWGLRDDNGDPIYLEPEDVRNNDLEMYNGLLVRLIDTIKKALVIEKNIQGNTHYESVYISGLALANTYRMIGEK